MSDVLQKLRAAASQGATSGIYSVCSAHPFVIRAAVQQALADNTPLLVEATSNQVNQFGGYSGMRPADFRDFVYEIAEQEGYAKENVILGGDHLGPNPWQHLPIDEAMKLAEDMVAEYSGAGFTKIHLDASMACLGEHLPLPDSAVAARAARLCRASEEASGGEPRYYVIGTEVPVPGGATESLAELEVTPYPRASETLETHRTIFFAAGLASVWPRVIALVVQPGVEFNHDSVVDYEPSKTAALRQLLQHTRGMVFEAHSTDYQRPEAFRSLVRDGFAILKVGPALTFALREALFSLERIDRELFPAETPTELAAVLDREMVQRPEHWAKHYHGSAAEQQLLRRYSYSDRIRYYWGGEPVQKAVDTLMTRLGKVTIPEPLLSAWLPEQYHAVRCQGLVPTAENLVLHKIRLALKPYAEAGIYRLAEPMAKAS